MSYAPWDAALTRIRELIVDGYGTRAISSSRFVSHLPEGLTEDEQARRGVAPDGVPIQVRWTGIGEHPSRLTEAGTRQIHLAYLEIVVVRTMSTPLAVDMALRDDAIALAIEDAEAIAQVLGWPGNLSTTSGGTDTGLRGIRRNGTATVRVLGPAGKAQRIETVHPFAATIVSSPAAV